MTIVFQRKICIIYSYKKSKLAQINFTEIEANLHNDEFELLQRFITGEQSAFAEIYNEFYYVIYKHALRWIQESEDSEDITADTFVKLWKNRSKFSTKREIVGFLHVTVRNASYDFLKHAKVKSRSQRDIIQLYETGHYFGQNASEIWEEFSKIVYDEVAKMPKRMREIFLLSYEQGLKPAQIAEKLNLNVQTISNQKYAAINLLKAAIRNNHLFIFMLTTIFKD